MSNTYLGSSSEAANTQSSLPSLGGECDQASAVERLTDRLGDEFALIFAFLSPGGQGTLRSTCTKLRGRFDMAVECGFIPFAVSFLSPSDGSHMVPVLTSHCMNRRHHLRGPPDLLGPAVSVYSKYEEVFEKSLLGPPPTSSSGPTSAEVTLHVSVDAIAERPTLARNCEMVHRLPSAGGSEMKSTIVIGDGFLSSIHWATEIVLTHGSRVEEVGASWMRDCLHLHRVIWCSEFPFLRKVGNHWLSGCQELHFLDFQDFPSLQEVGDNWLHDSAMIDLSFTGLIALTTVGNKWLRNVKVEHAFTFKGLNKLTRVGHDWLKDFPIEPVLSFQGLSELTSVGDNWLASSKQARLHFSGKELPKLRTVGNDWAAMHNNHPHVEFIELYNLTTIGADWLGYCERGLTATVRDLPHVESIGEHPFSLRSTFDFENVSDVIAEAIKQVERRPLPMPEGSSTLNNDCSIS